VKPWQGRKAYIVWRYCRPYDCAIWHVQVEIDEITWDLGEATRKEPVGRLKGCFPLISCAHDARGSHNQTEGANDQQH